MKRAKKFNLKDCYIFSLNGEVLWQKKYDSDVAYLVAQYDDLRQ